MKVVLKKKDEKKKIYVLGGLAVVAAYLVYSNFGSSDQPSPTVSTTRSTSPVPADSRTSAPIQRRGTASRGSAEFRPHFGPKRAEDRIDPNQIDPTLRLDLLAKVQNVSLEGGSRNLFQFGAAPPPPAIDKPLPKVGKIHVTGPAAPPPAVIDPSIPPVPQAPPIPLKYYGFTNTRNEPRKKAFFLDGEEIIVAREGETVKNRYKILHIGVNSIDMEDTQFNSKQTLPMEPEPVG